MNSNFAWTGISSAGNVFPAILVGVGIRSLP